MIGRDGLSLKCFWVMEKKTLHAAIELLSLCWLVIFCIWKAGSSMGNGKIALSWIGVWDIAVCALPFIYYYLMGILINSRLSASAVLGQLRVSE